METKESFGNCTDWNEIRLKKTEIEIELDMSTHRPLNELL